MPLEVEEELVVVENVGGIMCVREVNHKSVTNEYEVVTNPLVQQHLLDCTTSEEEGNAHVGADCIGYYGIDCLNTCDLPEPVIGGYRVKDEGTEEERLLRLEAQTRLCRSEFGAGYSRENAIRREAEEKKPPDLNDRYLYECGYDVSMAIEHPPPPAPSRIERRRDILPTEAYENSLELTCGHTLFDCGFSPFNCVAHPFPDEIVESDMTQWVDVDFTNWQGGGNKMDEHECQEMLELWERDSLEYNAWWPEARDGRGSLWIPGLWDHRNDYGMSAKHLHRWKNDEAAKIKLLTRMVRFPQLQPLASKVRTFRLNNSTVKASRYLGKWARRYQQRYPGSNSALPISWVYKRKEEEDVEEEPADEKDEKSNNDNEQSYLLVPQVPWRKERLMKREERRNLNMNYERPTVGSKNKRANVARAMLAHFYEQKEHKAKRDRLVPKPIPVKENDNPYHPPRPCVVAPELEPESDKPQINYREMLCPLEFMQPQVVRWQEEQEQLSSKPHDVTSLRIEHYAGCHPVDRRVGNLLLAAIRLEAQRGSRRAFDHSPRRDEPLRLYKKFLHLDFPVFIPVAPKKVVHKVGPQPKGKKPSKSQTNVDAGFTKGGADVIDLNFDLMDESPNTFSLKAEKLKTGIVYMLQRYVDYDPRVLPDEAWLLERMMGEWVNEGMGEEGQRRNRCWDYVTEPVPRLASERELNPGDGRDEGHAGFSPADFANMPEAQHARLTLPEILALRLYTGPAYVILQQSCRREGVEFQVTLLCLEMAIVKLGSKNREQYSVFRGVKGQMPAEFQGAYYQDRQLAIADKAFISATRDLSVALGPKYGGNIVYVFRCGAPQHAEITFDGWLKGGADVAWISQFPDEQEVLFPRYTELLPFPKAKRLTGLSDTTKQDLAASGVEVYEFEPTYHYNEKHTCPNLPGLRS